MEIKTFKIIKLGIFFVLLISLLNIISISKAIESDNSYRSPQSDKNYQAPTSGPGYVRVDSDKNYSSPKTGPGYVQTQSDKNYQAPTSGLGYTRTQSDKDYNSPTLGSGYLKPGSSQYQSPFDGPGFLNPNKENVTLNETIFINIILNKTNEIPEDKKEKQEELIPDKKEKQNETKDLPPEKKEEINETILNEIIKILNETLENQTETIDRETEDLNIVGKWRIYSQPGATTRVLEIKADHTWEFGTTGTWSVESITQEDWARWRIVPYGPTRKLILNGWNKASTDGPIEEENGAVNFFWSMLIPTKFGHLNAAGYNYWITINKKGLGTVTSKEKKIDCGVTCQNTFTSDTEVTLTATPNQGASFIGWSGACQGKEKTCTVTMERSKTIKAEFSEKECNADANCPLDQKCQNAKCTKVNCACGSIKNHQCESYECCSDTSCKNEESCNLEINKCMIKSPCKPYSISGDPKEKHDIVFIGDNFKTDELLTKGVYFLIDIESRYNGFFSVSPFKENKEKFNIWMINAKDYKHDQEGNLDPEDYLRFVKNCERDTVVVVSINMFRPYASFPTSESKGGVIYLSLGFINLLSPEFIGRFLLHEFGHAFGNLADEYIDPITRSTHDPNEFPNCASTLEKAKEKWGDLVGVEEVGYYTGVKDVPGTTYYKSKNPSVQQLGFYPDGTDIGDGGCQFEVKNIRPTIGSIMKMGNEVQYGFGPVNERVLRKRLEAYK